MQPQVYSSSSSQPSPGWSGSTSRRKEHEEPAWSWPDPRMTKLRVMGSIPPALVLGGLECIECEGQTSRHPTGRARRALPCVLVRSNHPRRAVSTSDRTLLRLTLMFAVVLQLPWPPCAIRTVCTRVAPAHSPLTQASSNGGRGGSEPK